MKCEIEESRSFSPWISASVPGKILVIRLQAIGDVVVTLPACFALRQMFPDARIDLLTSDACLGIPRAIRLFDRVHSLAQSRRRWIRAWRVLTQGTRMRGEHYDVIIDLQRHRASRFIRRIARPRAWGEFDRFSPRHSLERVIDTFHQTGFSDLEPVFELDLKAETMERALRILQECGWDGTTKLVILNPAGLWVTRNWPLPCWEELANLWSDIEPVRFLFLGTSRIDDRVSYLSGKLARRAISLINRTTLAEALGVLQHASVVISEDSGLLHMAWVSGIPTVALFGSTRSDWTRPLGKWSRYVASEDLPCGACMEATCRFGDVHCLSRHSAATILQLAREAERGS